MKRLYFMIFISLFLVICFGTAVHSAGKWVVRKLPDTGHTIDTTATFGEDADYIINPPSYTDNGNETITDNVTGLMWQKGGSGEIVWHKAIKYCEDLTLAGHTDWRLPGSQELFSIVNHSKPPFGVKIFSPANANYWWAINTHATMPDLKWEVNNGGGTSAHDRHEAVSEGGNRIFNAKCVRDEAPVEFVSTHFTDNGDGTVKDNTNGLIWQQVDAGKYTWEEAIVYCENLNFAGTDKWRLPNLKELRALCDDTLYEPAIQKAFFVQESAKFWLTAKNALTKSGLPIISAPFWSSTTESKRPDSVSKAWYLDFGPGLTTYQEKSDKLNVRCVHGGQ
ncbi:MAG: DUF1566 domain-containing protein [Deltaproteobacteria bacterium]|nr:DUF1566 domain-containing protein [Deltaproteobacteria bacterium]